MDTAGRVEKFQRRYGAKFQAQAEAQPETPPAGDSKN